MEFADVEATLIRGPEHCGWQDTWSIHLRYLDLVDHVEANHEDLYDEAQLWGGILAAVKLADGADGEGYELWYSPSDPTHIYLVNRGAVEAWALATDWFPCL